MKPVCLSGCVALGDKKAGPFKLEVEWIKFVRAGETK